jgi:hypothetical protein
MRVKISTLIIVSFLGLSLLVIKGIRGQSAVQPYTLRFTETSYGHISGSKLEKIAVIKRRSDGATARYQLDPTNHRYLRGQIRQIMLDSGRKKVLVDDGTQSMSTFMAPQNAIFKLFAGRRSLPNCRPQVAPETEPEYLGEQTIAGLVTHRYKFPPSKYESHSLSLEVWHAEKLDCIEVQQISTRYDEKINKVGSTFQKLLVSATLAEPDHEGFEVSNGYSEKKPSSLYGDNLTLMHNMQITPSMSQSWSLEDTRYLGSRK